MEVIFYVSETDIESMTGETEEIPFLGEHKLRRKRKWKWKDCILCVYDINNTEAVYLTFERRETGFFHLYLPLLHRKCV